MVCTVCNLQSTWSALWGDPFLSSKSVLSPTWQNFSVVPILGDPGAVSWVVKKSKRLSFRSCKLGRFDFLMTQLTAPGFPRMDCSRPRCLYLQDHHPARTWVNFFPAFWILIGQFKFQARRGASAICKACFTMQTGDHFHSLIEENSGFVFTLFTRWRNPASSSLYLYVCYLVRQYFSDMFIVYV